MFEIGESTKPENRLFCSVTIQYLGQWIELWHQADLINKHQSIENHNRETSESN